MSALQCEGVISEVSMHLLAYPAETGLSFRAESFNLKFYPGRHLKNVPVVEISGITAEVLSLAALPGYVGTG